MVWFLIDCVGLVGVDGLMYVGVFDIVFLFCFFGFVVMVVVDEVELCYMVVMVVVYDEGLILFCYLCGEGVGFEMLEWGSVFEIGKGVVWCEGFKVVFLLFGGCMVECFKVVDELDVVGLLIMVVDVCFVKLFDFDLICWLVCDYEVFVIVEEGFVGGFGSYVLFVLV